MSSQHARHARRAKTDKKKRNNNQTRAAIASRTRQNVAVVKKRNDGWNSGLATIQITRLRKQLQKAETKIKVLQKKCNSQKWNAITNAIEFVDDFIENELITIKIKFVFMVLIVYHECWLA